MHSVQKKARHNNAILFDSFALFHVEHIQLCNTNYFQMFDISQSVRIWFKVIRVVLMASADISADARLPAKRALETPADRCSKS